MSDLSNSLLKSMELLAQNTVQQSPGTTMIEATIYGEVVNEVEGEYKAQYLDSYLTVYSNDKNIKYNNGDKVYILVPNGDFGKRKIIISSSTSTNISYDKTDIDTFLPVSENLFNFYPEIKLKTYDNSINILEDNQYIQVGKEVEYDEDGTIIELNENKSSIYNLNILDSSIAEHSFNNMQKYY